MLTQTIDQVIDKGSPLQKQGQNLARTLHSWVLQGGEPARRIADILHGVWLGHPLHPVLTDIVIGSWALGAWFDLIAVSTSSRSAQHTADALTQVGVVAALPTAISGLTDFSTIPKGAAGTGLTHALLMDAVLGLYVISVRDRRKHQRQRGLLWSTLGLGLLGLGAYLGGHLVYGKQVGVNHSQNMPQPEMWVDLMPVADLPNRRPQQVELEGKPILLYRRDEEIYAVGALCPHAGAPLAEGCFEGTTVQCPWHDSVFKLQNGQVQHGPATYPLPSYEVRLHQGQVQLRATGK